MDDGWPRCGEQTRAAEPTKKGRPTGARGKLDANGQVCTKSDGVDRWTLGWRRRKSASYKPLGVRARQRDTSRRRWSREAREKKQHRDIHQSGQTVSASGQWHARRSLFPLVDLAPARLEPTLAEPPPSSAPSRRSKQLLKSPAPLKEAPILGCSCLRCCSRDGVGRQCPGRPMESGDAAQGSRSRRQMRPVRVHPCPRSGLSSGLPSLDGSAHLPLR
jgi:hypothetical protein